MPVKDIEPHKLDLAVLRLASELHNDKLEAQNRKEIDKLLWTLHKNLQQITETTGKLVGVFGQRLLKQQHNTFKKQLQMVNDSLDEDILRTETIQKLVFQLEGSMHNVNVDHSAWKSITGLIAESKAHLRQINETIQNTHSETVTEILVKMDLAAAKLSESSKEAQKRVRCTCFESLSAAVDLIHDAH